MINVVRTLRSMLKNIQHPAERTQLILYLRYDLNLGKGLERKRDPRQGTKMQQTFDTL